jgi:hypothetical protein
MDKEGRATKLKRSMLRRDIVGMVNNVRASPR